MRRRKRDYLQRGDRVHDEHMHQIGAVRGVYEKYNPETGTVDVLAHVTYPDGNSRIVSEKDVFNLTSFNNK